MAIVDFGGNSMEHIRERIRELVLATNRPAAIALVEEFARAHGYQQAMAQLVEPILHDIGECWALEKSISVAQVYSAASLAQDILTRIASERAAMTPPAPKGIAVIGNAEDDCHALGRRMVGTFLRADGWQVHDLGVDVMPATFVDKATEVGAKVIGVSAMMYTTAVNIGRVREELDRRGLSGKIMLAVGGAVFIHRPELMDEVGGDGTARNAIEVSDLFLHLQQRAH